MIKMYKDIAFTMLDSNFVFSNEDEKQECVSLTRHKAYEEIGYSFLKYKKDNPSCDFSKPVEELENRLSNSGNYIEYKLAIETLNNSKTYANMNDPEEPKNSLDMC